MKKHPYPRGKIFFARLISFIPGELLKMVPNKDREREYLQSVPALFAGKTYAAVVPFLASFRIPLLSDEFDTVGVPYDKQDWNKNYIQI